MTRVSVITGGAGGMGVATAKVMGRDHTVVLGDVRSDRLEAAAATLADLGIAAIIVECDVTDAVAVEALFEAAGAHGTVASVIHTAGVSPSMGAPDYIMRTNALGTVRVNEAFHRIAGADAAVVNVASMAAHLLPEEIVPADRFPLALDDETRFMAEMSAVCDLAPEASRSGFAYAVSKSFVRWYSTSQAERFSVRGLRVLSVSPGSVDTEMGRLEEHAGAGAMVADAAIPRWGRPEEMADLFAFCASERAGYLTGTDILNDGGVVASRTERARLASQRRS
jgi:NAD(P)-dependent dehydrogenase (short-subunit alcohol dehydrogenase family)